VVKCEISSYRAWFVDWDYSLERTHVIKPDDGLCLRPKHVVVDIYY
jgi:hypothetical protein